MSRLRIKEEAQEQKMSQKDLAEKSDVTLQLLNRYWNNNMQRVELEQLEKIAKALGVKSGNLIVDEPRGTEESEKLTKEEIITGIKSILSKLDGRSDHFVGQVREVLKEMEDAAIDPPLLASKFDAYIALVISGRRRDTQRIANDYEQYYTQLDTLLAQLER